jgi:hypothetical protein
MNLGPRFGYSLRGIRMTFEARRRARRADFQPRVKSERVGLASYEYQLQRMGKRQTS